GPAVVVAPLAVARRPALAGAMQPSGSSASSTGMTRKHGSACLWYCQRRHHRRPSRIVATPTRVRLLLAPSPDDAPAHPPPLAQRGSGLVRDGLGQLLTDQQAGAPPAFHALAPRPGDAGGAPRGDDPLVVLATAGQAGVRVRRTPGGQRPPLCAEGYS